jgi:hypothetical protein
MNKRTSIVTIAAAGALGLGISSIAVAATSNDTESQSSCPSVTKAAAPFERNASGQSVGRYVLGGPRPDLTPFGDKGYVKVSEWVPPLDSNCRPARASVAKPDENGDIKIPLYDREGKRIGEVVVGSVVEDSK